jgi:hypothetical protein
MTAPGARHSTNNKAPKKGKTKTLEVSFRHFGALL